MARTKLSLPLATYVGWGAGTLVTSTLLYATNALLLRYLTDFVGIAAATAGTLLAASKVFDALVDPPIGMLSDRTRSRWGRRRPWLLAGTLLAALAIVLLFTIPLGLGALTLPYVVLLLLLYAVAFSVFNIPYLAMPTEMIDRPEERSFLMQFRVYGSAVAGLLASGLAPWLLQATGRTHASHAWVGLTLAPFVLAGGLFAFFATRAAPEYEAPAPAPQGWRDQLAMLTGNPSVLSLLACDVSRLIGLTMQVVAAAYFTTYYLKASDYLLGSLFVAMTLAVLASQPLWVWLGTRASKPVIYTLAATGFAAVSLTWLVARPGEPSALLLARGALGGVFSGGLFLMANSMLPDAVADDYRRSGFRREGNLVAAFTFCEQISHAIAIAAVGWMLGLVGFAAAAKGGQAIQSAATIDAIRYVYAVAPALFALLSCVCLRWFGRDHTAPLKPVAATVAVT